MQIKFTFKEFEIFRWKKDAYDCAGIRAQVFRYVGRLCRAFDRQSKDLGLNLSAVEKRLFSTERFQILYICIYINN